MPKGGLLLCQTQAGNTDSNRLEEQFAAVSAEKRCCGDGAWHSEVPQRTTGPVKGTRAQGTEAA